MTGRVYGTTVGTSTKSPNVFHRFLDLPGPNPFVRGTARACHISSCSSSRISSRLDPGVNISTAYTAAGHRQGIQSPQVTAHVQSGLQNSHGQASNPREQRYPAPYHPCERSNPCCTGDPAGQRTTPCCVHIGTKERAGQTAWQTRGGGGSGVHRRPGLDHAFTLWPSQRHPLRPEMRLGGAPPVRAHHTRRKWNLPCKCR